jgi:hypothetical protein
MRASIAGLGRIVLLVRIEDHSQLPARLRVVRARLGSRIGLLHLLADGRQKVIEGEVGKIRRQVGGRWSLGQRENQQDGKCHV